MNDFVINKNKTVFILFFIIFMGASLRIFNLSSESFWRDEIMTINESSNGSLMHIVSNRLENGHGPLYFIFMHYWISTFGKKEFWVRFPSAIFGIALILLVYFLAKELFDTKIGLLSSFFQAIGTIDIIYSQEARMYSILAFFVILCNLFLIKIIKYKAYQANLYWLGYCVSLSICLFLSPSATLILISHSIYILFMRKKYEKIAKRFVFCALLISFIYAPLFWVIAKDMPRNLKIIGEHMHSPDFIAVLSFLKLFTPLVFEKIMHLNTGMGYVTLLSLYFIIVLLAIYYYLRDMKKEIASILLFILFIPPIILFIISKFILPIFLPRYVLFISTSLYIILAYSILRTNNKLLNFALPFLLVIFSSLSLYFYYINGVKPHWREILEFARGYGGGKNVILSFYSETYSFGLDYYNQGIHNIIHIPSLEKLDYIAFDITKKDINLSFKVKNKFGSEIKFLNSVYNKDSIKTVFKNTLEINVNFAKPSDGVSLVFPDNDSNKILVKILSKNYKLYAEKVFPRGWMLPEDIRILVFN